MNQEQQDEIERLGLIEINPCKVEEKRDEKGRIIWEKCYNGKTTKIEYDDINNIIWRKDSDGTTSAKKYDKNSNEVWSMDTDEIYYIDDKEYRKAEPLKTSLDKVREKFKDISGGLDIGSCSLNDIEDKNIHNQKVLGYLIGLREGYQKTH